MACMSGGDRRVQKGRLAGSQRSQGLHPEFSAVHWLLLPKGPVSLRHSYPSLSPYMTPPLSLMYQIVNQQAIDPFSKHHVLLSPCCKSYALKLYSYMRLDTCLANI